MPKNVVTRLGSNRESTDEELLGTCLQACRIMLAVTRLNLVPLANTSKTTQ